MLCTSAYADATALYHCKPCWSQHAIYLECEELDIIWNVDQHKRNLYKTTKPMKTSIFTADAQTFIKPTITPLHCQTEILWNHCSDFLEISWKYTRSAALTQVGENVGISQRIKLHSKRNIHFMVLPLHIILIQIRCWLIFRTVFLRNLSWT